VITSQYEEDRAADAEAASDMAAGGAGSFEGDHYEA
jgi:large subunit ribosomal protein L9